MPHSVHSTRESTPMTKVELGQRYWNVNIPESDWTEQCPSYLLNASAKNKEVLSGRDEDFRILNWDEVKQLIGQ
jgi:hypothetical protein